jgi:hypothetical protein
MRRLVLMALLGLAGCSGSIGGEVGKCVGAQVQPPSLSLGAAPAPPSTGTFTFSAPAGSRFAFCAW